ncbi:MAG TPA: SRPBCC domain-containing protein, partial [Acidimicrobiales bacterium]|nr:SRPBCC domain-containing protein [Acidimicrobiales bacterium]
MAAGIDQATSCTYTTYVRATPQRVWQGLTDPADTKRYWRHQTAGEKTFRSDWEKGSTWDLEHHEVGLVVSDPEQVILESDPYTRLAYTWHTFTPEWAVEVGMDEATADTWRAEPRSKVSYDIEDVGHGVAKLTVIHDGFAPG